MIGDNDLIPCVHAVVDVTCTTKVARSHHIDRVVHVIGIYHAFVPHHRDMDAPRRLHGDHMERILFEHHQATRARPPGT